MLTGGEGESHGPFRFDAVSLQGQRAALGAAVPPPQASHAVQEVMQILTVFCLGLVDSTMDLPRIGGSGSGCLAGFLALGEDLSDVGVVGFVHAVSLHPADDRSTT